MALIAMCCYDTEENGRSEYTAKAISSLINTVDLKKHRLVIIDNNSCEITKKILAFYDGKIATVITLPSNIGTARAINMGIKMRQPKEAVIKIDNDCVVHQSGWVEQMEEVIARDPSIGIVGLKRKDVEWDGELIRLPHERGEKWVNVEKGTYIMGTCTMFSSGLMDKIGGFQDCAVYGFDDTLISLRSVLSGFWNCYLPHIEIDHIDTGGNDYILEKQKIASEAWEKYKSMHDGYSNGTLPLYVEI